MRIDLRLVVSVAVLCAAPALTQMPSDVLSQARSLLDQGRIADSEARLRDLLAANPENAEAHFLLGYALFREQKAKESLAEFAAGAKYRHPRADELKVVAADYVMLGDYADADKWFSEVVAETPNDSDAWYLLGRARYNENKFTAAIDAFEHALTLRPNHVEAENNIGLSWKELNQGEKARAAFQSAIDWQGDSPHDPQPFLNLGVLLSNSNQNEQAIPLLRKAISIDPKNPAVHEQLGKIYMTIDRLPEAQSELEQAVSLAPNTSALHYKLGQILRKQGLGDRAQQEFAICERLNGAHSSSKTPNPPPPPGPEPK